MAASEGLYGAESVHHRFFLGATYGTCLVHGTTPSNLVSTLPSSHYTGRGSRAVPPVLPRTFSPDSFEYDIEPDAPTHCHPFWCQIEDVLVTRRSVVGGDPGTATELVANLIPRIPVLHLLCIPVSTGGDRDGADSLPSYMFRNPQAFPLPPPGTTEALGIASRVGMRLVREYLRSEGAAMKCLADPGNDNNARAAYEKAREDALSRKEEAIRDACARLRVPELPPDELGVITCAYEAALAAADHDLLARGLPGYGIKDVVLRAHVNAIFEWGTYDKVESARMALLRAVRNRAKRQFEFGTGDYTLENLADAVLEDPVELPDDADPLEHADYEHDAELINAYEAAKAEGMRPVHYMRPKVPQELAFASFFASCSVSECSGPVETPTRKIGGQFRIALHGVRPRFAAWILRDAAAGTRAPRPPCASENMTQWVKSTFGTIPSQAAKLAPPDIAATGVPSLSARHPSLSAHDSTAYRTLFGYMNPKVHKKHLYLSAPFIGEYFLAWDASAKKNATLPFITAAIVRTGSAPATYEFAVRCAERLRAQLGTAAPDPKRRKLQDNDDDIADAEDAKTPSALEAQSGADAKAAKPWEAVKDPELMQRLIARRAQHPWFQWLTMCGLSGFNPCDTITAETADTALEWASFTATYLSLVGVEAMHDQAFKPVSHASAGPEVPYANTLFMWVHRPEVLQIPPPPHGRAPDVSPAALEPYGLTPEECAHARGLADALHTGNTVLEHCTWRCTQPNLNLAYVQAVQDKINAQYRIKSSVMREARVNAIDGHDKVPSVWTTKVVDGKQVNVLFKPPAITRFFTPVQSGKPKGD